jgi:hypothetical protein
MRRASLAVVLATLTVFPLCAHATFHIMVIDQMFPGVPEAPDAQYVMLRTESVLQTFVHEQPVPIFDALGMPLDSFATFCSQSGSCDLPRVSPACTMGGCPQGTDPASNGANILIATPWAQELFCVTADLLATATLPYPDGRVCWGDCSLEPVICSSGPVDCVAYGQFAGDNGIFGQPAASPMLGEALVGSPERQSQFNGGNLLDNSIGFTVGEPTPRNYHGNTGALDGVAGDPEGTGVVSVDDVQAEVHVLFEAGKRCDLPAARRGADANFDTRINAADLIATIKIVTAATG